MAGARLKRLPRHLRRATPPFYPHTRGAMATSDAVADHSLESRHIGTGVTTSCQHPAALPFALTARPYFHPLSQD
jgi:hypothetical protein